MKPLLMFRSLLRKGALMAQIVNNPVMLLILRYVLPYSLAIFTFFTIVDTAEQASSKGKRRPRLEKVDWYVYLYWFNRVAIFWVVQQPFWYKYVVTYWHKQASS